MTRRISIATSDLQGVFEHLACCDCVEEAMLFRRVCAERDDFRSRLQRAESELAAITEIQAKADPK